MKLLIILVSITTVMCVNLFHFPMAQIREAEENCTKISSLDKNCEDLCALENSKLLTPKGDAINVNEFGPFYKKYAKECWTFDSKPSCKEAQEFLECYYEKSRLGQEESWTTCEELYHDKIREDYTHEKLDEDRNFACLATCYAEGMFAYNDDDTINMDCINPHIDFEFDAKQAARKCENSNKQNDKCQKRSHIFLCLSEAFDKARREDFTKRQSELIKV